MTIEELADVLVARRKELGWEQHHLAKLMKLSLTSIQTLEAKRMLAPGVIAKWAKALGVQVNVIPTQYLVAAVVRPTVAATRGHHYVTSKDRAEFVALRASGLSARKIGLMTGFSTTCVEKHLANPALPVAP